MVQYFGRELKIMKYLQNKLAKNNNFDSCIKRDRQTEAAKVYVTKIKNSVQNKINNN